VLVTNGAKELVWSGGFEPFGEDWNGAGKAGVFLRLPGQWDDETWKKATIGEVVYYNVFRWYQPNTGRYSRPDPLRLSLRAETNPFLYVRSRPLLGIDHLGLVTSKAECCSECDAAQMTDELNKAFGWLLTRHKRYWAKPFTSGDSCLTSALRLAGDIESALRRKPASTIPPATIPNAWRWPNSSAVDTGRSSASTTCYVSAKHCRFFPQRAEDPGSTLAEES
jgi:RHS repeat-associated protein